ncbi:3-phosphoglycerate dehydrogenase family protein [Propioniciclava tarda]|uniref:3-phosphoglycerate dehydrogenase n=1 Tax=Propioniciclava tarda TaxID=433330 RepID=A0A4Q9KN71_PROTD|nr:3-phosphoglycerate dehydrogenase family protein [Propioniciclava tarda]TBT95894.1 3-phosphoglycerate dehydrogenase [Propioniciclava tarda]SMO41156.1 D-3-phosphoglycerate dehydrogenase [Propioniciclava tarda]HOA89308.1 3-phosphoglycerate dehydrogenase family protein [Propioniciclava tarda]HQA30673.1 3-phosphoglycerate dehydrogenase family protein [Propioniciclava tarda]HQD60625.1 3-phosphoglycerate dehydrogenase family protein [Propioniciclava tarda]
MYKIATLNNISPLGLDRLPKDRYEIGNDLVDPDAYILRSFKMHGMEVPASVVAVARAGAGTNNIPVDEYAKAGIVVFNTPGANANAVKELVLAGMLVGARNISKGATFADGLEGTDEEITKAVEAGKKNFVGFELPGKTLGVIGLGAIGGGVANSAVALGMNVIGYDPAITINHAWNLSSSVERVNDVDEIFKRADVVTVHVPLIEPTKNLVNAERLAMMKPNGTVLNFARGGIVDDAAIVEALNAGRLGAYVCDFPSNALKGCAKVLALPHLGASTNEAEDNCAVMAAQELRDFLENGNITNSVNFPEAMLHAREDGETRLSIASDNAPDTIARLTGAISAAGLAVAHLVHKSRGDLDYTLLDVPGSVPGDVVEKLKSMPGVRKVRVMA